MKCRTSVLERARVIVAWTRRGDGVRYVGGGAEGPPRRAFAGLLATGASGRLARRVQRSGLAMSAVQSDAEGADVRCGYGDGTAGSSDGVVRERCFQEGTAQGSRISRDGLATPKVRQTANNHDKSVPCGAG